MNKSLAPSNTRKTSKRIHWSIHILNFFAVRRLYLGDAWKYPIISTSRCSHVLSPLITHLSKNIDQELQNDSYRKNDSNQIDPQDSKKNQNTSPARQMMKNNNTLPPFLPRIKLRRPKNPKKNSNNRIPSDKDEEWEFFFQLYQQHYLTNKNADISPGPGLNQSLLRNWCANQRKSFMKTLGILDIGEKVNWGTEYMTFERKKRLDSVGFYWGANLEPTNLVDEDIFSEGYQSKVSLKYKDWIWNPLYERLVQFYQENGHTNVPSKGDDLGTWVVQQRMTREIMPDRRRRKLDALGFNWHVNEDVEGGEKCIPFTIKQVTWAQRIRQLTAYKEKYGDTNVPLDYDEVKGLGRWVKKQRENKKLSVRSRMQLASIGFEFSSCLTSFSSNT